MLLFVVSTLVVFNFSLPAETGEGNWRVVADSGPDGMRAVVKVPMRGVDLPYPQGNVRHIDGPTTVTYGDLHERARRCATLIARQAEPGDVVDAVLWLAGPESRFVTGQTITEALANSRRMEAKGFRYSYDLVEREGVVLAVDDGPRVPDTAEGDARVARRRLRERAQRGDLGDGGADVGADSSQVMTDPPWRP